MRWSNYTEQFFILGKESKIQKHQVVKIFEELTSKQESALALINASFLDEKSKKNYTQAYQRRLKKIVRS